MAQSTAPLVGVIMGSDSDWPFMQPAALIFEHFRVQYEARAVSAHRTPDFMTDYAKTAASRGLKYIIAGAGGAAHLPGMVAANTRLPVLGVPIETKSSPLLGLDALFSIGQMPGGIPVATFAIGEPGAKNAALFVVRILALSDPQLAKQLEQWHAEQAKKVLDLGPLKLPQKPEGG